jgi:hypothetical protein
MHCGWILVVTFVAGCELVFPLDTPCPNTYQPVRDRLYRLHEEPLQWLDAEAACKADAKSATTHLATARDRTELSTLQGQTTTKVWIGAGGTSGVYVTLHGDPIPVELWDTSSSQPNPAFPVANFDSRGMATGNPTEVLAFLCECDGRPVDVGPFGPLP